MMVQPVLWGSLIAVLQSGNQASLYQGYRNIFSNDELLPHWASVTPPLSTKQIIFMNRSPSSTKAVVLVVEDDLLLRLLTVAFIEEAGFDVIDADSADAAVAILEARTNIRIVFTDIDMPGSIDGIKLAAAVRDRWPPIEIVIVSGHTCPVCAALPNRAMFFSKPYDIDAVTATLHRMAATI